MTIVRRTNPFGEMLSLRQAMERLFDVGEHHLPLDIRTSGDAVVVEAALPGVKPQDVEISVLGDTLTISASHRDDQTRDEEGYSYREIRRGTFTRTVGLPTNLRTEAATATFDNGLLILRIPRAEEAKPRLIPVSTSADEPNNENPA